MSTNSIIFLCTIFISSTLLCYSSIWILLKSSIIHFFTDKPNIRKVHQNSTPRAGGVCIVLCFLGILFFWNNMQNLNLPMLDTKLLLTIILLTGSIFLVGLLDDTSFIEIKNKYKFIYEILITTVIVLFFNAPLKTIFITPNLSFSIGWLGIPLSILWIVGITNAMNIIDGIDGLASSTSLIGFLTIGVLAGIAGHISLVILCIVLAAVNCGFLFHNISPARIFLGDTGSLFLGSMLGFLTLYIVTVPEMKFSIFVAPILLVFPIMDVFIAMFRRYIRSWFIERKGFSSFGSILRADNEHIHHRLMYKGLNHTNTCMVLVLFSLIFSLSAVVISFISNSLAIILSSYLFFIIVWFIIKLNFADRIISYFNKNDLNNREESIKNIDSKALICIINSDDVLQHSLEQCKQNYFSFNFLNPDDFPIYDNPYSVVIINNITIDQIENDKKLSKKILQNKHDCHVVITVEYDDINKLKNTLKLKNNKSIFIKGRPLYIPQLLVDIYPYALNYHKAFAFENAFIKSHGEEKDIFQSKEEIFHSNPILVD